MSIEKALRPRGAGAAINIHLTEEHFMALSRISKNMIIHPFHRAVPMSTHAEIIDYTLKRNAMKS